MPFYCFSRHFSAFFDKKLPPMDNTGGYDFRFMRF